LPLCAGANVLARMSENICKQALPDTLEGCHEYIHCLENRLVERESVIAEREALIAEHESVIAEREALIAKLQKQLFGQRSEKSKERPPEPTPQEIAEETAPPKKKKSGGGRAPLPEYLPRVEEVVDIAENEKLCACCGKPMKPIGEDASEQLDVAPVAFFVRRTVRPRYACCTCKNAVVQAPMPTQTLPRTGCTPGLAAHLALWKYEDHLPLCRLERILRRGGIDLDRTRTSDWLMTCSELLEPLVRLMHRKILESGRVCADETTLKMQAPDKAKTCWLWAVRGLDDAPYTVFRFNESRGASGLLKDFENYKGMLLTDAYSAYDKLAGKNENVSLHGCWAHARRKFVEARDGGDKSAPEAIALIGKLYETERNAAEMAGDERLALRREQSASVLDELKKWLHEKSDALPKSPLGKAINYTLDRWPCLVRLLDDGAMPIDNNALERDIRPVAIGRKNWLFAGSPRGGRAAAVYFSLLESTRRAGVNTFEYMKDLLTRLPDHPITRLDELLPDRWKPGG
jgi:transposase/uncharacterized coiled-coil protein SlyX